MGQGAEKNMSCVWGFRPKRAVVQVLTHVAERLTDLHACGYVHRDIKPGNVMWLPRKNRWTLIDFGCAARTGEKARKGFSFSYAAPEVIKAVRAEADLYDVSEGVDVWSVGILAIEMFTGKPVYSTSQTKDTVRPLMFSSICVQCMACRLFLLMLSSFFFGPPRARDIA